MDPGIELLVSIPVSSKFSKIILYFSFKKGFLLEYWKFLIIVTISVLKLSLEFLSKVLYQEGVTKSDRQYTFITLKYTDKSEELI